jgi:sRNA-binding carbon storage regulator CsrA
MLVLSLLQGKVVFVAGPMLVTVAEEGNRPRLGFAGDPEIPVVREEVLLSMIAEEVALLSKDGLHELYADELAALHRAYEAFTTADATVDTLYAAISNDTIMELLLGFRHDTKKQAA